MQDYSFATQKLMWEGITEVFMPLISCIVCAGNHYDNSVIRTSTMSFIIPLTLVCALHFYGETMRPNGWHGAGNSFGLTKTFQM